MATLSITSTLTNINPLAGVDANLVISTDIPFTSPPATVDLVIRVEGLVPDKDFSIDQFTWVEVSPLIWDGTYNFGYQDLTPTNPFTFIVEGLQSSLIGDIEGVFSLPASADYSVDGGADEVTLTYIGNSNDFIAVPPFITFDNGVVVGIKTNALISLANNSGSNIRIFSLLVKPDTLQEVTIFYENAGVWTEWIEGVTSYIITNATSKKYLVQLQSQVASDYSLFYLEVGHSIGAVQTISRWAFEPDTVSTDIVDSLTRLEVDVQNFTWFDGVSHVLGDCPNDTVLGNVDSCRAATVDIDIIVTNESVTECRETEGYDVRLGDITHGWYPFLVQNIEDSVITFPVATTDDDYHLAYSEELPLTVTVDCPVDDGEHTVEVNIVRRTCLYDTDPAVATYVNGANIAVLGNLVPITDTDDFIAISLDDILQGVASGAVNSSSITFIWADHAVNEAHTVNSFTALEAGDYTFVVQYVLPEDTFSTVREYGLFVNSVFDQIVVSGITAQSGEKEITLTLAQNDTVQFAVFHDVSNVHIVAESFTVAMRLYDKASIPLPENVCSFELSYTKIGCDSIFSPLTLTKTKVLGTLPATETMPLIITNTGDFALTISSVIIEPVTVSGGLTLYFPVAVVIPIGLSQTFNFAFTPTVAGVFTGNVHFVTSCGGDIYVPFALTVTEAASLCTILPTQSQYNVEVDLDVATIFTDIVIDTNNNTGTLEITKGGTYPFLTFGASPLGDTTIHRSYVVEDQAVTIPVIVEVTGDCPQSLSTLCTMNWLLRNEDNDSLCSGTFDFIYTVICPVETICPLSVQDNLLDVFNLHPLDTGTLTAGILLDRDAVDIGDFVLTFRLPAEESVFSFATQSVVTGLTWDISGVGNNPALLIVSVDAATFVGSQIDMILDYVIPTSPTQPILFSTLSVDATFDSGDFTCVQNVINLALSVIITGTSGGYETVVELQEAVECESLNVLDQSGYAADANHDLADFSLYRKITVSQPTGVDYVLSTHAPYDELILPASSNVLSYPITITDGGVYSVELVSVPIYNFAGTYSKDDCVVIFDTEIRFYKSLDDINTQYIPELTPGWEDYWLEVDEPLGAYISTAYYVQKCDILVCKHALQRKVWCEVRAICETDICKSKCHMNLLKYELLEAMLIEAESYQQYSRITSYYNDMKLLCDCNTECYG